MFLLFLLVFGKGLQAKTSIHLSILMRFVLTNRYVLSCVLMTGVFVFMYKVLPDKKMDTIAQVRDNMRRVLGRDALVEVFERAVAENAHPDRHSKPVLMRRACQILIEPVVVAVECTQPELVDDHWKRYFTRRLRQRFELTGAPVKLNFDREIHLRKDDEFGPNAVVPEAPAAAPEEELDE